MPEPTDDALAEWFRPTSGSGLAAEDISQCRAALGAVVSKMSPDLRCDLVEMALIDGRPKNRDWLVDAARTKRPAIPLTDNEELVSRIAAASLIRALTKPEAYSVELGLMVQSAAFLGLKPRLPEVLDVAEAALRDAAVATRLRPTAWRKISGDVESDLDGPTESQPDETGATTPIDVHANAIVRLAAAIDALAERVDDRLVTIDEEYDALWWSYSARSEGTGEPWAAVEPTARRVVLSVTELGGHLQRVPSPPIVRGLIAAALGDAADAEVSLAEVARAAAAHGCFPETGRASRLLPIESAVTEIRRLDDADGDTWKTSLKKALHVNADRKSTALDAACQLRREVEIGLTHG